MTRLSAKIHRWLALLLVVPMLFWFVSGLFFAAMPIEKVRSEHVIAEPPPAPVALAEAGAGLQRLAELGISSAEKVELRQMLGRPVALVTGEEKRPRLYDLTSGALVSPIPARLAAQIAERGHSAGARAKNVSWVDKESPEYRGALPAWRVDFEDGANRSFYVAADTGLVTARRSSLWRAYDFLWSLHILDFHDHEDFNTPLLTIAAALGLVIIVTGIVLFPSRLGYTAWRQRRRSRKAKAG